MSLAVVRVPLGIESPFDEARVSPLCGLIVEDNTGGRTCWLYAAPHRYDHPAFQLLEWTLRIFRVGPRISLAVAMKLTNSDLEPGAHAASIAR